MDIVLSGQLSLPAEGALQCRGAATSEPSTPRRVVFLALGGFPNSATSSGVIGVVSSHEVAQRRLVVPRMLLGDEVKRNHRRFSLLV